MPSGSWERLRDVKKEWGDAVGADPDSLDDWPALRIVALEEEVFALAREVRTAVEAGKMKVTYHVEREHKDLGWLAVCNATGSREFCEGWVAAMDDSSYPSGPMRIVATTQDGDYDIVVETKGRR